MHEHSCALVLENDTSGIVAFNSSHKIWYELRTVFCVRNLPDVSSSSGADRSLLPSTPLLGLSLISGMRRPDPMLRMSPLELV
jgi:hypothetical protein